MRESRCGGRSRARKRALHADRGEGEMQTRRRAHAPRQPHRRAECAGPRGVGVPLGCGTRASARGPGRLSRARSQRGARDFQAPATEKCVRSPAAAPPSGTASSGPAAAALSSRRCRRQARPYPRERRAPVPAAARRGHAFDRGGQGNPLPPHTHHRPHHHDHQHPTQSAASLPACLWRLLIDPLARSRPLRVTASVPPPARGHAPASPDRAQLATHRSPPGERVL